MDPVTATAVTTEPDSAAETGPCLTVRCWGTRGSIPSPGPATAGYGGNTPCIEVRTLGRRVVFDAGSGMRLLGLDLMKTDGPNRPWIFLTHFHWDHIQGFPFFAPLYHPEAELRIFGPMQQNIDIKSLFAGQMGPIYFPVPFSAVAAKLRFDHLNEGSFEEDGITVSAMRVRHPSFTVGYRLEAAGASVCYIPDNELVGARYDWVQPDWRERLVEFVRDADVLLHDAMFTDDEYPSKTGWGHSTFRQSLALASEAGVKRLLFYHHAPERSDRELSEIVNAERAWAAAQGLSLEVDAASEGEDIQVWRHASQ